MADLRSLSYPVFILLLFVVSVLGTSVTFSEEFNKTIDFIIQETNKESISNFLKHISSRPHYGGTPAEWENADWVANVWREQGLDEVHQTPYNVLFSFPDKEKPNYAKIFDADKKIIWTSQGFSPKVLDDEKFSDEFYPDFNAFAKSGNVMGEVVYANYGAEGDFEELEKAGVDVKDRIVIARYGEAFRGNIVNEAEKRGALGVLLYSDPQETAPEGEDHVYPNTVYLPGNSAAVGTVYLYDGDPLTPFYPSIESAFRLPEEEAAIPKIPVMPLGYDDARQILSKMGGQDAPTQFQGKLNITYKLGPGLEQDGWTVGMEVISHLEIQKTVNVIGVIKGSVEPDRYVIIGNHRDAWGYGSVDPNSGTAALLEISRLLADYRNKTGWRPRRSLIFCSWGSEEPGLIGSLEWTEQFATQLRDRAVAYLNMDMVLEANFTLETMASPILYAAGEVVTKVIPNPDAEEYDAGRTTVYDTWIHRKPNKKHPAKPSFLNVGAGSDFKGFQHNIGVPSLNYYFTYGKDGVYMPLYHTRHDSFFLVSELYDRGFNFHAAMVQMKTTLAAYLADSEVLPFSVDEYSAFIKDAQEEMSSKFQSLLNSRNISLDLFLQAGEEFAEAAQNLSDNIAKLNLKDPLAVRRINDQLMMVERAFINPHGLPGRPELNHIVMAPSASNVYAGDAFSGLSDALSGIEKLANEEKDKRWRTFEEHLAVATHFLQTAGKVLSDNLW